jgi:hypothetical protein
MEKREWKARTKRDLMIEVWEHLDCESVGASELKEIEHVVRERFGAGAVESPARVARLLADEGAELRHAEVLEMDARERGADPYDAMFRNVLKFSNFAQAASSIKNLDNLIADWFSVWLRQPEIFHDWLELRQRSAAFREQFTENKNA